MPPPAAYDPLQLAVLDHRGVFKGKKVGLFAGEETDGAELKVVQSSLKSLGVHVVESAVDGAPQSDEVATNQQAALIAQRFQQAGVNEVVAVGTGATVWPESLQANESTYLPAWIATDESGLESAVLGILHPAEVSRERPHDESRSFELCSSGTRPPSRRAIGWCARRTRRSRSPHRRIH